MSRLRTCLSLSLFLAAAAANAADTAAQARDLFVKGQQAMAAGKPADALVSYEGSYKVSNAPTVLFFIAEARRAMGEDAKALATYEEYLAKLPNAPKKVDAEARIVELRAKIAAKPKVAIPEIDLGLDTGPAKTPTKAEAKAEAKKEAAAVKAEEKKEAAAVKAEEKKEAAAAKADAKKGAADELAMDELKKPARPLVGKNGKKLTKLELKMLAAKEAEEKAAADKAAAEKAAALKAAEEKAAAEKLAAEKLEAEQKVAAAAQKAAAEKAAADKLAAEKAAADKAAAEAKMDVRPNEPRPAPAKVAPPPAATTSLADTRPTMTTTAPAPAPTQAGPSENGWQFAVDASLGVGMLSHTGFGGYPTPNPQDSSVVPVESLGLAVLYRMGSVAVGLYGEAAIAGKPEVFGNDLLLVLGVGPRVEFEAGKFRIGVFGSKVLLPQQDALSLNFSVGADVGMQLAPNWGLRLRAAYVAGTGIYPTSPGAAYTSNTVSMVPISLGVHWTM